MSLAQKTSEVISGGHFCKNLVILIFGFEFSEHFNQTKTLLKSNPTNTWAMITCVTSTVLKIILTRLTAEINAVL